MLCRLQVLGLVLISFGAGLLVGGLLSSCFIVWLLAFAAAAAGVLIIRL